MCKSAGELTMLSSSANEVLAFVVPELHGFEHRQLHNLWRAVQRARLLAQEPLRDLSREATSTNLRSFRPVGVGISRAASIISALSQARAVQRRCCECCDGLLTFAVLAIRRTTVDCWAVSARRRPGRRRTRHPGVLCVSGRRRAVL